MRLYKISKFLLILILPILLFLLVLNFVGFDNDFYEKKFEEYKINQKVADAVSIHGRVIDFIRGKIDELPNDFNEREMQHLWDVRSIIKILSILLYIFIALFVLLLIISAFTLKINNLITNFVSKVLIFGGFLTIVLALGLFSFISLNFEIFFELFHSSFFQKGTYAFDPAKEIIVRLYPEQIFMDLGIRISKLVIIMSIITILIGTCLLFRSKNKRHK